jgi:hypothetical protein
MTSELLTTQDFLVPSSDNVNFSLIYYIVATQGKPNEETGENDRTNASWQSIST